MLMLKLLFSTERFCYYEAMKILLTSNGLTNETIARALEEMVDKPRKETRIAFVPTAALADDGKEHSSLSWFADDICRVRDFCGFLDIVSLSDLASEVVHKRLEAADAIVVGGGNAYYLSYWMDKSGMFDSLPKLLETRVYVGISAGSMIATQSIRTTSQAVKNPDAFRKGKYDELGPKGRSAGRTAELVDFVMRPHLDRVRFPGDRAEAFKSIVADVKLPLYAVDDANAIKVIDGSIEVIGEGNWVLVKP